MNYFQGTPLAAPGQRQWMNGFMRERQVEKRQQAEERNAQTASTRRRSYAREHGYNRGSQMVRELKVALYHIEQMETQESVVQTSPL